jgi:hypothetical protein
VTESAPSRAHRLAPPPIDQTLVSGPLRGIDAALDSTPRHGFDLAPVGEGDIDPYVIQTAELATINDYKSDSDKPPLMQAVLIPFGKTLLAVAAMMEDMKHKHKLEGAKDPFQEWRQLPNAKWRLANAGARHATTPFAVNTKDGTHLHIVHAIWGLMAAHEKYLEEDGQDIEALL